MKIEIRIEDEKSISFDRNWRKERKSIEKLHFSSTEKLERKIVIVYLFFLCFQALVVVIWDGKFWFLWESEKEIYANKTIQKFFLFFFILKLNRFFKATSYQKHVTITRSRLSTLGEGWGCFLWMICNCLQFFSYTSFLFKALICLINYRFKYASNWAQKAAINSCFLFFLSFAIFLNKIKMFTLYYLLFLDTSKD